MKKAKKEGKDLSKKEKKELSDEDASLEYTGINKYECENIGLWDTVITRDDYEEMFKMQQASLGVPVKKFKEDKTKPIITEKKKSDKKKKNSKVKIYSEISRDLSGDNSSKAVKPKK